MSLLSRWADGSPDQVQAQTGKYAGIAKILAVKGSDHSGMGILVDRRHVITCAHVVSIALNRKWDSMEQPAATVPVSFPMLGDALVIQAKVVKWCAPGPQPQDDIAVLELEREAPESAGIAELATITGMPLDHDALSVFGLEEGDQIGNHIDARFKGATTAAWIQIDGATGDGPFVEGGFSGAAVWDYPHAAVLGMMVAKRIANRKPIAYMIPARDLRAFWPDLQVEYRPQTHFFARTWTIFAFVFFLVVFAHWSVNRGVTTLSFATAYGAHKQLASFWGMHLYAFLAPVLLVMLIGFARSWRLHDWWKRVPSFSAVGDKPVPSSMRRTAAIGFAAFVVLPFAAQIHFIRGFHNEGYVYIYPSSFGFKSEELKEADGWTCDKPNVHLCTRKNTDRYTLVPAKPDHEAGYWKNAYHYGDRDGPNGKSSTYFPILQPVVIILLTLVNALLSLLAGYLVFRRPANQIAPAASAVPNEATS